MTKQVRQSIIPTHVLGSTGTAQGDNLGYRALTSFKGDLNIPANTTAELLLKADITDVGTAPNEIPLNQYLGALAYQDTPYLALSSRPIVPLTSPAVQDVIDALLALGLVRQED